MRRSLRVSVRSSWLWVVATLFAVATALIVASDLATIHQRAQSLGPERQVVVAAHDLELGAPVTAHDLELALRHDSQTAAWSESSLDGLVGRTVAVPVLEGGTVSERHLASESRPGPAGLIPPGMRAVRVPDPAGLDPRPGSLIDVIVAFNPVAAQQLGVSTITPVTAARVLAPSEASESTAAGSGQRAPRSLLAMVSVDEAERLAFAVANGDVTLALAPPEAACCATSSSESSKD